MNIVLISKLNPSYYNYVKFSSILKNLPNRATAIISDNNAIRQMMIFLLYSVFVCTSLSSAKKSRMQTFMIVFSK